MNKNDPSSICRCPPNGQCTGPTACDLVPAAGDQWQVVLVDAGICGPGSNALGLGLGLGLGLSFLLILTGAAGYYAFLNQGKAPSGPAISDQIVFASPTTPANELAQIQPTSPQQQVSMIQQV